MHAQAKKHLWLAACFWLWACQPAAVATSKKDPNQTLTEVVLPGASTPQCQIADDCPAPEQLCAQAACVQGACKLQPSQPGTRCPLTLEWAQRQADLMPIDMDEKGVCREYMCMPRVLCTQYCVDELAQAIAPSVEVMPCPEGRCNQAPDPEAVATAKEGLRACLLSCGFPDLTRTEAAPGSTD